MLAVSIFAGASSSLSAEMMQDPVGRGGSRLRVRVRVWRRLETPPQTPPSPAPFKRDLRTAGWCHEGRLLPMQRSPRRVPLALRGGGEGSGEDVNRASAGEVSDAGSTGIRDESYGSAEHDEDFSLGAVSEEPAILQNGSVEQAQGILESTSNRLDDAPAADVADRTDGDGDVDGMHRGEISQHSGEDDVDIVECQFERIGDKNGVFYYLGQQMVGTPAILGPGPVWQNDGVAGAGGSAERTRFQNPALTGRVQIKTGPLRILCCSKFKGRISCPEEVLERNVVGDQFHFPDGWVAVDLGVHTTLRPSHYMLRNGGAQAHDRIITGWVLEGATWVKGDYWREGDWAVLDKHTNNTCFRDLALQAEADGSAAGYLYETAPPMRVDHRTGKVTPAIHPELAHSWHPTPIGDLPHHTLSFPVHGCERAFRFIRLRQLTHAGHTHFGEEWRGHEDLYLQGMELYGTLSVNVLQSTVAPFTPCDRGMLMFGLNRCVHCVLTARLARSLFLYVRLYAVVGWCKRLDIADEMDRVLVVGR